MSCTCLIGCTLAPEALQELDEALRTNRGSLGKLAGAYGLKKPTLGRHKLRCLGVEKAHGGRFQERTPPTVEEPPTPEPETSHETSRNDRPFERDGPPRARAEPSQHRENSTMPGVRETSRETAETARIDRPEAPTIDARALATADPAALGVVGFGDQVRFIADMLVRGAWKDRRSVTALCAAWGLGRDAVHERHRAAAVLAGQDRGAMAEQLENTIGGVTLGAEECEAQALALENPVSDDGKPIAASEDARQLALKYRALAAKNRAVRMRLEGLLVSRVSVSLEGDPRLAGWWPVLWEALAECDAARLRYIERVEELTQGALPGDVLPVPSEVVEDAMKRYETQIGARSAPALAGKVGA